MPRNPSFRLCAVQIVTDILLCLKQPASSHENHDEITNCYDHANKMLTS